LFAEERHKKILKLIEQEASAKVARLSKEFNVSESTIRRDLKSLEEEGLIKRTHGGAVANGHTKFEPSFSEKENKYLKEKERIGKVAADLVNDGDTIILDAGTTTTQIAKNLFNKSELTVITNGVNIAIELVQNDEVDVLLIGGSLKQKTLALVGPVAQQAIKRFKVDKTFVGVNGITVKDGLTTPDIEEAEIKRMMINSAKEVTVVADHSKFGEVTFTSICSINKINRIITDKEISNRVLDEYKRLDMEVNLA